MGIRSAGKKSPVKIFLAQTSRIDMKALALLKETYLNSIDWLVSASLPRRLSAFFWFIFVAMVLGQLGSIIIIFNGWWSGKGFLELLSVQAASGSLVVYSTALLTSSSYFLIREYLYKDTIESRPIKAITLLVAVVFVLLGTLIASNSLTGSGASISSAAVSADAAADRQNLFHWFVYSCSIVISLVFWFLDDRDSARIFIAKLETRSRAMATKASRNKTTSNGVRI